MTNKRSLEVSGRGRASLMMGLAMLLASLDGCGPGETPAPASGGASPSSATTTDAGGKAGRPKVDTSSRRAHQKQQVAAEKTSP